MRQIINVLLRLPKWYGLTIILIYSVMIAEFVKVLNTLFMVGGIEKVALMEKIVQLNYGLTIVSSIIVWILICLLFHLMALLFDGKTTFGSFLIVAAYPYFIPAVILLFAVLLLDGISIKDRVNGQEYTKNYITHSTLQNGGTIDYVMGDKPNKNRGIAPEDAPYSFSKELKK